MKKLLLITILAIILLSTAHAESVNKFDDNGKLEMTINKMYQCEKSNKENVVIPRENCLSESAVPSSIQYQLLYLMNSQYTIKDSLKVVSCVRLAMGAQPFYAVNTCPADPFTGPGAVVGGPIGTAFSTSKTGTQEMLSCKKSTDGTPRFVIAASCPTGYIRWASLGHWPTNTDVPYELEKPTATPPVSEISPPKEEAKLELGPKTLLACTRTMQYRERSKTRNIDDYYSTTEASCSIGPNQKQIGIMGKTLDYREPDTVLFMQCRAPFKTDKNLMVSTDPKCEGQEIVGPLGYASTVQKEGMLAVRRCRFTANNDHFLKVGEEKCGDAAYDEGIIGHINPYVEEPKPQRICCLMERKEGEKVSRKTKITSSGECKEMAEKGFKIETIEAKTCEQDVCCEIGEKRGVRKYEGCWEEQGKKVEVSLEECKIKPAPPVQAPAEDCTATIKQNEQLTQQYKDLMRKRDELKGKTEISPPVEMPAPIITLSPEDRQALLACRRTVQWRDRSGRKHVTRTMHDYYQSNKYPCPEGETLSIIGGTIGKSGLPDTAELVSCQWPAKGNERLLRVNSCDPGTDLVEKLGFVFTKPKPELGTIALDFCVFGANGEHFATTGGCGAGNSKEATVWILPFCEETDKGKEIGVKGKTTSFDETFTKWGAIKEDTCSIDVNTLVEYSCDATVFAPQKFQTFGATEYLKRDVILGLPGVKAEIIHYCPQGTQCDNGACKTTTAPAPIVEKKPECVTGADCWGGLKCIAGNCVRRITCVNDAGCPAGYKCVTPTTPPYTKECR